MQSISFHRLLISEALKRTTPESALHRTAKQPRLFSCRRGPIHPRAHQGRVDVRRFAPGDVLTTCRKYAIVLPVALGGPLSN